MVSTYWISIAAIVTLPLVWSIVVVRDERQQPAGFTLVELADKKTSKIYFAAPGKGAHGTGTTRIGMRVFPATTTRKTIFYNK